MDDSEEEMLSQLLDLAEDMYKAAGAYNSEGINQVRQIVKNAKYQRRVLSECLVKEGMTSTKIGSN